MAALVIGYFGVNAYSGNRGLRAKQDLDQQIAQLSGELAGLRAERGTWERRVSLLRPDSIDPDMLDERARALLNYADPRELTLRLKQPGSPFPASVRRFANPNAAVCPGAVRCCWLLKRPVLWGFRAIAVLSGPVRFWPLLARSVPIPVPIFLFCLGCSPSRLLPWRAMKPTRWRVFQPAH
ncbi:MAG: FtsB family cell division protein [Xanthobacteraceae bacterium]